MDLGASFCFSTPSGGLPYGSSVTPNSWGSGGGASHNYDGGSGAGVLSITVGRDARIQGTLSADGLHGTGPGAGGGAGGSISLVVAGTLTGSGNITADGGSGVAGTSGWGGGGAGGRISVTIGAREWTRGPGGFEGVLRAAGGSTRGEELDEGEWSPGVGVEGSNLNYTLSLRRGWSWVLSEHDGSVDSYGTLDALTLINEGSLRVGEPANLSVVQNFTDKCDGTGILQLSNESVLVSKGDGRRELKITRVEIHLVNATLLLGQDGNGNLTVGSGGRFRVGRSSKTDGSSSPGELLFERLEVGDGGEVIVEDGASNTPLIRATQVIVKEGGSITANGRGEMGGEAGVGGAGGELPGESSEEYGGGGGHAGRGGHEEGDDSNGSLETSYGSVTIPIAAGSGGGASLLANGGQGGGVISIWASGEMRIDGNVTANGGSGGCPGGGGGAGGSVYINVGGKGLWGTGTVAASGGDACSYGVGDEGGGGGGSGGRVAVFAEQGDDFKGTLVTEGG
ncbi:unnamed protein product, partial [Discosporangium mesarthrocarpum]